MLIIERDEIILLVEPMKPEFVTITGKYYGL